MLVINLKRIIRIRSRARPAIRHRRRHGRSHNLIERNRVGQCKDVCSIARIIRAAHIYLGNDIPILETNTLRTSGPNRQPAGLLASQQIRSTVEYNLRQRAHGSADFIVSHRNNTAIRRNIEDARCMSHAAATADQKAPAVARAVQIH